MVISFLKSNLYSGKLTSSEDVMSHYKEVFYFLMAVIHIYKIFLVN